MIDKRVNYRFGSEGYQGGATNQGGAGRGSGVSGGGARGQAMGTGGKQASGTARTTGGSGGPDRSAVGQFSQYGRNVFAKNLNPNLRFNPRTGEMNKRFGLENLFGGALGFINPLLGLAYRGITGIPGVYDKFKDSNTFVEFRDKLRGYGKTMPTYSNNPAFGGLESLINSPTDLDNLGELVAEITQADRDRFKQPMTQMMDYDTYKSINTDSTLTREEFEQLKATV
jgi:hypothetical protein